MINPGLFSIIMTLRPEEQQTVMRSIGNGWETTMIRLRQI